MGLMIVQNYKMTLFTFSSLLLNKTSYFLWAIISLGVHYDYKMPSTSCSSDYCG